MTLTLRPIQSPRVARRHWLWGALIVLCTFAAFGRLSCAEFLTYDDFHTVQHNPRFNPPTIASILKFWPPVLPKDADQTLTGRVSNPKDPVRINHVYGLYIPLTYTVWGILAAIAQTRSATGGVELNPWVFHCANIALHAMAGVAVFALLRRFLNRNWPAAAGALLFVLHPMQVEAVGWISGMKDVLCGMLSIAALWQYVRFAQSDSTDGRGKARFYALATTTLVCALLAKPSAATVPLLAMVIDVLIVRRRFLDSQLSLAPWFVIAAILAAVAALAQPATGVPPAPLWARPLLVGDSLAFYLYKLLCPIKLGIDYGRRPDEVIHHGWLYFTWLVPAALAVMLFLVRRREGNRIWTAAALVFVLAPIPTLGLLTFLFQYYSTTADHYLYVAMLGPALVIAWALQYFRSSLLNGCVVVVLIALAARTVVQAGYWHDDRTIFSHSIAVNPYSFIAQNNLGSVYFSDGDLAAAQTHFLAAHQLNPRYPEPLDNLHRIALKQGRVGDAINWYEQFLATKAKLPPEIRGDWWNAHVYLANLLIDQHRYDEAIDHFEAALRFKPGLTAAKEGLTRAWRLKNEPTTRP